MSRKFSTDGFSDIRVLYYDMGSVFQNVNIPALSTVYSTEFFRVHHLEYPTLIIYWGPGAQSSTNMDVYINAHITPGGFLLEQQLIGNINTTVPAGQFGRHLSLRPAGLKDIGFSPIQIQIDNNDPVNNQVLSGLILAAEK